MVNLGSLNADWVYRVPTIVTPGETLGSAALARHAGGKGLNQSVALARAGAMVSHIGAVGSDGTWLREALAESVVDASGVAVLEDTPTGHAIIQVDDAGENAIVLFGGANQATSFEVEAAFPRPSRGDWMLTQNETNGVAEAITAAKRRGVAVALNPAPMSPAVASFPLDLVDLLVVNETESRALGDAARRTLDHGGAVVTTLGAEGAVYRCDGLEIALPAARVDRVVDTTAAGDTFVGYLLASLVRGDEPEAAMRRAGQAAALCVTRAGAMPSIPWAAEVDADAPA
ncbi:MAG: ribokinase [Planctomycetota bacterium]